MSKPVGQPKRERGSPLLSPPRSLLRKVGRAVADFDMIREGDRVVLGLSGGKDSLSLLHILLHLQRHAPIRFDLAVITVDPTVEGFDPAPLAPYVEQFGVRHLMEAHPILDLAQEHMVNDSYCAWCARMKRGVLYAAMRREGFNVLALGQHLDDLAESLMMSMFHGGQLRTMKAHYTIDAGDLRVIRPLVYVRERQTAAFAADRKLPVINENCPACFSMPTRRYEIKQLLASEERGQPALFRSLLTAMRPLLTEGGIPPRSGGDGR
jgi:tRNA 2-thiocytidine biosynthesis protein TtcA